MMEDVFQTLKHYYSPGAQQTSPPLSPHHQAEANADQTKARVSVVSPRSSTRTPSPLPSPSRSTTTTLLNTHTASWHNVTNPFAAALFNTVRSHGSKAAILYPSLANPEITSTISWNELGIAATRVGRALHHLNKTTPNNAKKRFGKRDAYACAMILANTKESVMLHVGSLLTGVVPLALDPTDPPEKLRGLLHQLEPAIVFLDSMARLELLNGCSFIKRVIICDISASPPSPSPSHSNSSNNVAISTTTNASSNNNAGLSNSSNSNSPLNSTSSRDSNSSSGASTPTHRNSIADVTPPLPDGVLLWESFLREGQKLGDEEAQQVTTQGSKMDEAAVLAVAKVPRGSSSTSDSVMVFPNSVLYCAAKSIGRAVQVNESDTLSCLLPLSDFSQLIFGVLLPLLTGASVYLSGAQMYSDGVTRLPLCPSILALDASSWETVFKTLGLRVAATGAPKAHGALYRQLSGLDNCRAVVSLWGTVNSMVRSYFEDYYEIGVCELHGPVELAGVAFARPPESKGSNPAWHLAEGVMLRSEKSGDLSLRADIALAYPYKSNPENQSTRSGEYFSAGDVGLLTEPNRIVLVGKREDLVTLGGTEVSLAHLDALLRMLPAVSAAVTLVTDAQKKLMAVLSLDKNVIAAVARKLEVAPDMLWAAPEMLREVLQTELQLINSKPPFRNQLHQFLLLAPGEFPKLEDAMYESHQRAVEVRAICKDSIGAQLKSLESAPPLTKLSQTDELEQSLSNSQSLRRSSAKKKRYNTASRSSADSSFTTPPSSAPPSPMTQKEHPLPTTSSATSTAAQRAALDREELSKQIAQAKEADTAELRRTGSSILRLARRKETEEKNEEKASNPSISASSVSSTTATSAPMMIQSSATLATGNRASSGSSPTNAPALGAADISASGRKASHHRPPAAPQYRQSPRQSDSEIRQWVESVVDLDHDEATSFPALLRDGVVLCKLANALSPGSVARFNMMKGTFFHLENINFFLQFAKKSGVSKFDLFDPKDLTEEKGNFEKVLITLDILHKLLTPQT